MREPDPASFQSVSDAQPTAPDRADAPASLPPARLGRALRRGVREAWDRLGSVLGVSLTWMLLLTVPLTVGRALPPAWPGIVRTGIIVLMMALTLSAPAAGAFTVAHLACAHEEVSYMDFWRGAGRLFGPATRLGLFHTAVRSVFAVNLWFYASIGQGIGIAATLVCLYALLFWEMMAIYHFPLLVAQEAGLFDEPGRRAKRGVLALLRRAFYLALGDSLYTVGLLAAVLTVTVLYALTAVLPALLWLGTVAFLTTQATRALLVRYGVLPPPTEGPVPEDRFHIPPEKRAP
jgi:hypothetical protein